MSNYDLAAFMNARANDAAGTFASDAAEAAAAVANAMIESNAVARGDLTVEWATRSLAQRSREEQASLDARAQGLAAATRILAAAHAAHPDYRPEFRMGEYEAVHFQVDA